MTVICSNPNYTQVLSCYSIIYSTYTDLDTRDMCTIPCSGGSRILERGVQVVKARLYAAVGGKWREAAHLGGSGGFGCSEVGFGSIFSSR